MTGVEPTRGKVHVGISVDQVAAQALGKETQFASLELSTEHNNELGGVSFASATTPLPFTVLATMYFAGPLAVTSML